MLKILYYLASLYTVFFFTSSNLAPALHLAAMAHEHCQCLFSSILSPCPSPYPSSLLLAGYYVLSTALPPSFPPTFKVLAPAVSGSSCFAL